MVVGGLVQGLLEDVGWVGGEVVDVISLFMNVEQMSQNKGEQLSQNGGEQLSQNRGEQMSREQISLCLLSDIEIVLQVQF